MSSTGRKNARGGFGLDDFPTPRWCVYRLLEAIGDELPSGLWSEPCAGAGNIIRAVDTVRSDVRWLANELNEDYGEVLSAIPSVLGVTHHDARQLDLPATVSVAITNPPFDGSEDVLVSLLAPGSLLPILLQRLNWCGGPRAELFRQLRPSVFPLPNRPSFRETTRIDKNGKTVKSSTDSIEYAWFVFDGRGRFQVLGDTPADVRAAEKAERRLAERFVEQAEDALRRVEMAEEEGSS